MNPPIPLRTLQLPVRVGAFGVFATHTALFDAAGNVIAIEQDEARGCLVELAAVLNTLHARWVIENGEIDA